MAKVGSAELLACFKKVNMKDVKFLTPTDTIKGLFV